MVAWALLAAAIVAELFGTLGLRQIAASPTWWGITLIAVAYAVSFACMAISLRQLNVGVVYAIWSAVGTAAVTLAGVALFGERLNWHAVGGMALIVLGVIVLVSSGTVRHS
ncbi:MAG TPA: multidrug efflux SMR transporter [Jatrophihabitans sp.]|nr:multidrug efflux SMR transporter [Jatrophihabitans sp.]